MSGRFLAPACFYTGQRSSSPSGRSRVHSVPCLYRVGHMISRSYTCSHLLHADPTSSSQNNSSSPSNNLLKRCRLNSFGITREEVATDTKPAAGVGNRMDHENVSGGGAKKEGFLWEMSGNTFCVQRKQMFALRFEPSVQVWMEGTRKRANHKHRTRDSGPVPPRVLPWWPWKREKSELKCGFPVHVRHQKPASQNPRKC